MLVPFGVIVIAALGVGQRVWLRDRPLLAFGAALIDVMAALLLLTFFELGTAGLVAAVPLLIIAIVVPLEAELRSLSSRRAAAAGPPSRERLVG